MDPACRRYKMPTEGTDKVLPHIFGILKSNVIFSDTSLQKEVGGRKAHTIKRQRVKHQVSHGSCVVISGLLSFS